MDGRGGEAFAGDSITLQLLLESFPDGSINVFDRDLRYLFAGGKGLEQVGLSSGQLVGRTLYELFEGEPVEHAARHYRRAFEGETVEFELRLGALVYGIKAAPLQREGGEVNTIIAVAFDVTGRKKTEEALRESEERFRAAFGSAALGMTLTSLDGRYLQVNRRMCEIVGYSKSELLKMRFQSITHPDDLAGDTEGIRRLLDGEIPYHYAEKRYVHKSGRHVWALLSASLVRDAAGEPLYFVAQVQDITERKRDKERLERLSRQNELILASAGEGIYGLDRRERITFANPAAGRMLGYAPDDLIGRHQHEFLRHARPDGTPCPDEGCPVYAALRDGDVHVFSDDLFRRKDGSVFHAECVSTPIQEDGTVTGAVVAFRDITERKRAEAALARAARAKSEFLAEVSHELRTPLTVIRGNAEIALEMAPESPHGELLEEIVREAGSMTRMVEDLLFLSRSDSPSPPFDLQPVSVRNLADALAKGAESLARRHGVRLKLSESGGGLVRADPMRLKQAVLALVDNAAKHGGRSVALSVYPEGGTLRIAVEDDGPGIPAGDLPRVFERFYRAEGSVGAGLGLSIAAAIVEAHGGGITAESRPGEGTLMTISLPMLGAGG